MVKNTRSKPGVVVHARKHLGSKDRGRPEFKASSVYRMSFRIDRAPQRS